MKAARVLVVDDEARNRALLRAMLELEGHEVSEAADGPQALASVRQSPPDLVLLDVMMPGMDGYAVVRALKANPATQAIPVVLVTALDDRESRLRGLDAGAEEFVCKPVDRAELRARVRNLLKLKRLSTGLAEARDEANAANQAKSAFLAAMSHEIRTPLNGVVGMIEVLHQTSLKGYQVEMLDTIRESAFALLGIIEDLLDFSKIEAGRLDLECVPISVAETLEKTCAMLDPLATRRKVELTLFTDPALPASVVGDGPRLRQIVINLVNNAIKFSSGQERAGRVSLRAEQVDLDEGQVGVAIQVVDNGIGMDEAIRERLFEPFCQADASITRRFGGTGLGLAIARNLSKMMGGGITVCSVPSEGSSFTVRLPLVVVPGMPPQAPGPSLDGLGCLVIGAAGGLAEDWAAYLRASGLRVERAADLEAARSWEPPALEVQGPWIWLLDAGADRTVAHALPSLGGAAPAEAPPCVVIERGQRRRPRRYGDSPVVQVDANGLTRLGLLKAVALAAGRLREEDESLEAERTAVMLEPPSRAEALKRGQLLLVAEDNETNRKVIRHQLGLLGYLADLTEDGEEALKRWAGGDYALLLTDLHMPKRDGYDLVATIRAEETRQGRSRLPIIALTANALKTEKQHCLSVGMDGYLPKPVLLEDLKAMLDTWMPRPANAQRPEAELPSKASKAPAGTDRLAPGTLVLDTRILAAQVGGDRATLCDFLRDFQRSAMTIATELGTACRAGQAHSAEALAHKLKSSARSVGALPLGELCAELEAAGKAEQRELLLLHYTRFEQELAAVHSALATELDRKGMP